MYDITIIGGGPGGYKCAELMARKKKVALIEEDNIGGVCLNQGCIPFKSYLHYSRVREEVLKIARNGIFNIECFEMDQSIILQNKRKIIKGLQQSVTSMLKNLGVDIIDGKATSAKDNGDTISIFVNDKLIESSKLVIATGSKEKRIFEDISVKYSKDMLELDYIPKSIIIIGGGVIGLETAAYYTDVGSKVSIIEAMGQIGGTVDSEVSNALHKILTNKGIDVYTESVVEDVKDNTVIFRVDNKIRTLTADYILCSIGRSPRICMEIVKPLGVEYTNRGIVIDDSCRTSNLKVYACGDVTGKLMLAHTAYKHAKVISDCVDGNLSKMDYSLIPRVIYTNPEVLSVGLTEKDCIEMGITYLAKSLPMTYSGKYFAENGKDGAKAKMIVDGNSRIVGFHMIGNGASEFSIAAEMMIMNKMTVDEIKNLVFAHPTYSEIVAEISQFF